MRGRDDRAAANQRAIDALYQARRRAVTDCHGRPDPTPPPADHPFRDAAELTTIELWDRLSVTYLRAEWPPSMLN